MRGGDIASYVVGRTATWLPVPCEEFVRTIVSQTDGRPANKNTSRMNGPASKHCDPGVLARLRVDNISLVLPMFCYMRLGVRVVAVLVQCHLGLACNANELLSCLALDQKCM